MNDKPIIVRDDRMDYLQMSIESHPLDIPIVCGIIFGLFCFIIISIIMALK